MPARRSISARDSAASITIGGPQPTKKPCAIVECPKLSYVRGLCSMHHEREKKYGDPHRKSQKAKTIPERFWEKVDAEGDCWEWTGALSGGYGQFRTEAAVSRGAHRWSWEHLVGPIPSSMQLDHLCRNRRCVNPDHLEPVPQRTNVLRGYGAAGRQRHRK